MCVCVCACVRVCMYVCMYVCKRKVNNLTLLSLLINRLMSSKNEKAQSSDLNFHLTIMSSIIVKYKFLLVFILLCFPAFDHF